ncbi:MAG: VIT domain-containing protein [Planctomycetaceae bacterium]
MNDEPQIPADATLHRLLTTAIGPDTMSDEEIESRLNSIHPSIALSDEQTQRIVGKVNRLLNSAPTAAPNSAAPLLPVDQRPRLVSATTNEPPRPIRIPALAALLASLLALVSVIVLTPEAPSRSQISQLDQNPKSAALVLQGDLKTGFSGRMAPRYWMTAKQLPDAVPVAKVSVGDDIATGDLERRRVTLPDGSVLYVNSGSQVKIATARRVEVTRGEVFVEVVPAFDNVPRHPVAGSLAAEQGGTLPFEVVTQNRTVTALGTKFSVSVDDSETDVMVTQGKVKVSGIDEVVGAGQQVRAAGESTFTSAPQASADLEWTRDLMAAATGPLVPKSEYSGGALVTVDPNGQSSKLSLRKYHIDVHIEDGFARTTIDQTYFNHSHSRLEGTFHFPLPTDASLSRLAMYVNGKLMEGGMAERDHARNTFEEIKRKMLDPALLEWVDGSTFKMRVFPLEPRQEKRIVLSYSQRLHAAAGQLSYRFPAGHTMEAVRDWSAHVRIKGGAGSEWHSQSHTMTSTDDAGDLVLDAGLKNALMDRDLVCVLARTPI